MAGGVDTFLGSDGLTETAATEIPLDEAREPEQTAAVVPPDAPDPPAADEDPQVPEDVVGLRRALQANRAEKRDHKGRADKLEGENAAIKAQLAEALKAQNASAAKPAATPIPAAATPQSLPPLPNPAEDPDGYARALEDRAWNRDANRSERLFKKANPDVDTKALAARFLAIAPPGSALFAEMKGEDDPYSWIADHFKRAEAAEKIGPDPAAWEARERERIRAEEKASWMAEMGIQAEQPSVQPLARISPSLGSVRSAAPRGSAVAVNIPEEFDDILSQFRKKA